MVPRSLVRWPPPSQGHFTLNWNAVVSAETNMMEISIIIRDAAREVLVRASEPWSFFSNVVGVECWALLKAMELCTELRFSKIEFEGNAQLIVQAVKEKSECLAWYGELIEEAKFIGRRPSGACSSQIWIDTLLRISLDWRNPKCIDYRICPSNIWHGLLFSQKKRENNLLQFHYRHLSCKCWIMEHTNITPRK